MSPLIDTGSINVFAVRLLKIGECVYTGDMLLSYNSAPSVLLYEGCTYLWAKVETLYTGTTHYYEFCPHYNITPDYSTTKLETIPEKKKATKEDIWEAIHAICN